MPDTHSSILDQYGNPIRKSPSPDDWWRRKSNPYRQPQLPASQANFFGGTKRRSQSQVDAQTLRILSYCYPVARGCITWRKLQVQSHDWKVAPKKDSQNRKKDVSEKRLSAVSNWLNTRGNLGGNDFNCFEDFVAALLEDLLVLDAVCAYRLPKRNGQTHHVRLVNPETIEIITDDKGWVPAPPQKAFRQVIEGKITGEWSTEEMLYYVANKNTTSQYGMAPLEFLVTTVEQALRAESWNLAWFTKGNIPEGLYQLPPEWTPDQWEAFKTYWDSVIKGNTDARSGNVRFVPGGGNFIDLKNRKDLQFSEMQRWLATLTCIIFGINPTAVGLQGEVYKHAQEGQIDAARLTGSQPDLRLIKRIVDEIIRLDLNEKDVEFLWIELAEQDKKAQAETQRVYVESGIKSVNEVREEIDYAPREGELTDELMIIGQSGPIPLEKPIAPPENANPRQPGLTPAGTNTSFGGRVQGEAKPQPESNGPNRDQKPGKGTDEPKKSTPDFQTALADLRQYKKKCLRYLEEGKANPPRFTPNGLPDEVMEKVATYTQQFWHDPETLKELLDTSIEKLTKIGEYGFKRAYIREAEKHIEQAERILSGNS
jgi:HK97 family phage portal protein